VNVSKIDPEPSATNSFDLSQRVNILGVGVMPLNLGQAVAELDKWQREGIVTMFIVN
jgi:hypothetical protein